jgi:WD40 repeat protein
MVGRAILVVLTSCAAISFAACDYKSGSAVHASPGNASTTSTAPIDIGQALYEPATPKPRPTPAASEGVLADPVVVRNCQVTLPETQNVPSKNDGKILAFCTEVAAGETIPESEKVIHPRTAKVYRRLRENDIVKPNQLIAILDDEVAAAKKDVALAAREAADAKKVAAVQLQEVARQEFKSQQQLKEKGVTTDTDYRRAQAQHDQSIAGVAEAIGNLRKAEEEYKMALVVLGEHEIRSSIPGIIRRFYRRAGESVKALEPVAEIQNPEMLRIEGLLDYQYLSTISAARNLKVVVEPSPQFAPVQNLEGHLQAVRAVAVSKDPKKPLIVSACEDKTVRVWDRITKIQKKNWEHGTAVRAVACTPPGATANLCLTGADDGVPRLYDLDTFEPVFKEGETPDAKFKGRHTGQITSVAFAPDGKFCATADNKDIFIWDVTTGELKYKFPPLHKAPITYIQFTPQAKLLSEARDRSMAIWKLGQNGAAIETVVENRSNDVGVLSANADGTRVLFDQDRKLQVLTTDKRTEGVMQAPSEATQFTGFALFSPDDRLVLAAGTGDNPLQLWKAPQPGVGGALIRRLALPPGGHATCGAFSPDGTFAVTGTQDCRVLVWSIPTKQETDRVTNAEVKLLDATIDTDRKARIWATLPKPEGISMPAGDTVNIVIPSTERR